MKYLRLFWAELQPSHGRGARDLVALFCLVQGARLFAFAHAQPVNLLPSPLYGACMLVTGALLLGTRQCVARASYRGRAVAVLAACLWLLLAFDVRGAWLSFGNALVIAAACANEVRFRDC